MILQLSAMRDLRTVLCPVGCLLSPAAHGVVSVAHGRLDIVAELHTKVSSSINLASRELPQRTRAIGQHTNRLHIQS